MKTTNKRTKLFGNDLIIKSTFPCEPNTYQQSKVEFDEGIEYLYRRVVAFAIVEDWRFLKDGDLPGQSILAITYWEDSGEELVLPLEQDGYVSNTSLGGIVKVDGEQRMWFWSKVDLFKTAGEEA